MFFVLKQKTAYELRISDWSSDVCSTDLSQKIVESDHDATARTRRRTSSHHRRDRIRARRRGSSRQDAGTAARQEDDVLRRRTAGLSSRSEEHTSELQSLMRISYAVFCLKKKHKNYPILTTRILNAELH